MALPGVKYKISDGALLADAGPQPVKTALIITAEKFTIDGEEYFGTDDTVTGVHTFKKNPSFDLTGVGGEYGVYAEALKEYNLDKTDVKATALQTAVVTLNSKSLGDVKPLYKAYTSAKRLKEQLDLFYAEAEANAEVVVIGVKHTVNHPDFVDQTKDAFKKMIETMGISLVGTVVSLYKHAASGAETINAITHNKLVGGGTISIAAVTKVPKLEKKTDTFAQAVPKAQEAGDQYILDTEQSLQFVLDGRSFNADFTSLKDYRADPSQKHGRVSVMLSSVSDIKDKEESTAVGLALGRLQSFNVSDNIGWVQKGALKILGATYLGEKKTEQLSTTWNSVYEKGYLFLRQYPGLSGYFFTSDPTVTTKDSDYRNIVIQRVLDKARSVLYRTYLPYINGKLDIDSTTGLLSDNSVNFLELTGEQALSEAMIASDEVVDVGVKVPAGQDVIKANGKVDVEIRLVPKGYVKEIVINLGFSKTV